ncbi:hypothetical protein CVT24_011235 [Panaeolus cyanescens]|uniref:Uncharacterized protein n=1 Tax=Panaeolus cyanescens TaxID=181874 RepID=A0A409YGF8_9AGAR|nr:hypothetical protein CVT24_011235 [Panaeolus cyanescens]
MLKSPSIPLLAPGTIRYYGFKQPAGGKLSICSDCRFFANTLHINAIDPGASPNDGPTVLYSALTKGDTTYLTNAETIVPNATAPFSNMTFVRFELDVDVSISALPSASSLSTPQTISSLISSSATHLSRDPSSVLPSSVSSSITTNTVPAAPFIAIISGVVGSFILLILACTFLWFHFIRNPQKKAKNLNSGLAPGTPMAYSSVNPSTYSPFIISHQHITHATPPAAVLPGHRMASNPKGASLSTPDQPHRPVIPPSKLSRVAGTPSDTSLSSVSEGIPVVPMGKRQTDSRTLSQGEPCSQNANALLPLPSKFSGGAAGVTAQPSNSESRPRKLDDRR